MEKTNYKLLFGVILLLLLFSPETTHSGLLVRIRQESSSSDNWTYYARIAGGFEDRDLWNYDGTDRDPLEMPLSQWENAMSKMKEEGVNTVDVDLSFYYYDTFTDPNATLSALEKAVTAAHNHGLKVFAYQAGLEMQTENADQKTDTVFKTHPDWLQRGPNGEYAKYDSSFAFWIAPGDEDVWVTPLNPEWRQKYMDLARKIASTGIDALYIDVPYFIDWSYQWGSFDEYMKAEFTRRTGLQPPTPDQFSKEYSNFRAWINFRSDIITEFLRDLKANITTINPNIKLVTEIYGGYAQYGIRYGAEIEKISTVVDVITHEFGLFGDEGASKYYTPENWLFHSAVLSILKGVDGNHPTWMLQYAESYYDSIMLGSITAGLSTNFWETKLPDMLRSASETARKTFFTYISTYQHQIYGEWEPVNPVLLYYSATTKEQLEMEDASIVSKSSWDEATGEDYPSYFGGTHVQDLIGITMMLLSRHIPVKIVTKHTIQNYLTSNSPIILPSVNAISDSEIHYLQEMVGNGSKLLLSGENGKYDEKGNPRNQNGLSNIPSQMISSSPIGKAYLISLLNNENTESYKTQLVSALNNARYNPPLTTNASENTLVIPYKNKDGKTIVRVINFEGVKKGNQKPASQSITFTLSSKNYACHVSYITIYDLSNNQSYELNVSGSISPSSTSSKTQEEESGFLPTNTLGFSLPFFLSLAAITRKKRKTK